MPIYIARGRFGVLLAAAASHADAGAAWNSFTASTD